jgi:hypothetical protein
MENNVLCRAFPTRSQQVFCAQKGHQLPRRRRIFSTQVLAPRFYTAKILIRPILPISLGAINYISQFRSAMILDQPANDGPPKKALRMRLVKSQVMRETEA